MGGARLVMGGTVDSGVGQDLSEPLDQLGLGLALEFAEVAMRFKQRLLDQVGPAEAHKEALVLLQLAGLQQKEGAILRELPVFAVDHGFYRGKMLCPGHIIKEARAEFKHHSPLILASALSWL